MPELRRDDPIPPVLRVDRVPDQPLRTVVPVTLRRVDQVDPQFLPPVQDRRHLVLREFLAPLPAELPRPDAHHRDLQPCLTQLAIFHVPARLLMTGGIVVAPPPAPKQPRPPVPNIATRAKVPPNGVDDVSDRSALPQRVRQPPGL